MAQEDIVRMTHQRRVILEELAKDSSHPTADRIYRIVRRRLPRISLGTVYRNLEILAETGAIKKIETAGTQKRFDGDAAEHYHIRCVKCGKVDDVSGGRLEALADLLRLDAPACRGYKVTGCRLELTGLCPSCRRKKISSPRTRAGRLGRARASRGHKRDGK